MSRSRLLLVALCLAGATLVGRASPQAPTSAEVTLLRGMLGDARSYVEEYYYDRTYRGIKLGNRVKDFDARVRQARSFDEGLTLVSEFLGGFNDSHTYFIPPLRPEVFEYGYRLLAVGNDVFVRRVKGGSDAAASLRVGDQVLAVNGHPASRTTLLEIQSLFGRLQPQREMHLSLRSVDGALRDVTVRAEVRPRPPRSLAGLSLQQAGLEEIKMEARESGLMTARTSLVDDVLICQFPSFLGTPEGIDALFREIKKHRAMVLDLRGNPGGFTAVESRVITNLFTKRVTIGEQVTRFGRSRETVPGSRGAFVGRLIVLIDARSASASELLARIVQLEGRGTVLGDRSAGAVMEGVLLTGTRGFGTPYSFSITRADLLMTDGHSLEGRGVTPDELLLPTAQDLAAGRDPVLSRAARLLGLDLDPVAAGRLFPYEWR